MANYPQELAQDAVCQSHTGHMTEPWFRPSPAFKAEGTQHFLIWGGEIFTLNGRRKFTD